MEYITTESRNVISRKSRISGSKHIVLAGKSLIEENVILRGDRSQDGKPIMALGQFCILRQDCKLDPPQRQGRFYPLKIGSCVYIGRNTAVKAASIGSYVLIGDDCEIGEFVVIKDCAVIPANTKVPDFAVVSTSTELPESAQQVIEKYCREIHAGIEGPFPFSHYISPKIS